MNDVKKARSSPLTGDFDLSLVANFAHQIINPLNGIAGSLDRLHAGKIEGEHRRKQRIQAMRAQVENCIVLTRNLSYLAIGFGELLDSDRRTVVLPQNLIEACQFFDEEAREKGIKLQVLDRAIQNQVAAHPELIRQVLMNLIDNAVKYSDECSEVLLMHHIQRGTSNAIIRVRSTPKFPILSTDLQRIFDVGFRGDNARNIVASGTGLGLFICKEIIETAHQGELSVSLFAGRDLEFMIKVPRGVQGKTDRRYVQGG